MAIYLAEAATRAAQSAAKEAEEDLKTGLYSNALDRLNQAKAEIADAIHRVRQQRRMLKEQENRERAARSARINAARS